jgi:hypothetical protein
MAKTSLRTCLVVCSLIPLWCFGVEGPFTDSVVRPASTKYTNMNFLKRMFLGKNYRAEWAKPVKMAVFDIKTVKGGFTPGELGGGQQTKSLRLKDKQGEEWVLRTVDKEVEKALQPHMRKTFVKTIVQDMVSASHPYAPLTVYELARAVKVAAPNPTLYFIPEDPALGEHYKVFANTVCMLERREPTPDKTETEDTEDVIEDIMKEPDHLVIQEQVLRARLLDMLIADWDRHIDQWRWGKIDSGSHTYYYVIPRDRDFAYFDSRGILVNVMSWISLPHMRGFTEESKGLTRLNHKSIFFDNNFLNELDKDSWERIIADFQRQISDSVISRAIKRIPPEVYAISGAEIERKLRSRRDGMMKNGLKYYKELASIVHVMGTDKPDFFRVSKQGDDMAVTIYTYNGKDTGDVTYHRVFKRSETAEIFLEGFGDDDHFEIEEGINSKIILRIYGGEGQDKLVSRSKVRDKLDGIENEQWEKSLTAAKKQMPQ